MRFLQVTQFDSLGDLNSWLKDRGERPDIVSIMPFMTGPAANAERETRETTQSTARRRMERLRSADATSSSIGSKASYQRIGIRRRSDLFSSSAAD